MPFTLLEPQISSSMKEINVLTLRLRDCEGKLEEFGYKFRAMRWIEINTKRLMRKLAPAFKLSNSAGRADEAEGISRIFTGSNLKVKKISCRENQRSDHITRVGLNSTVAVGSRAMGFTSVTVRFS